ncbi:MAG: alpha/beta hydrolase [Planctomycetota bacterium]
MRWLLIRGLGRLCAHWHDFPQIMREQGGASEAICLNLPGFGEASNRATPVCVPRTTDDLRARWLERCEQAGTTGEPWGVLGLSLGGMVALDWLERFPGEFACGVVVNTSIGASSHPFERMTPTALLAGAKSVVAGSVRTRERRVLDLTSGKPDAAAEKYLDDREAIAKANPIAPLPFVRQLLAAARYPGPTPGAITTPCLVVVAEGDKLASPRCSERLAERLGMPIERHPWAGHDFNLDDPVWLAERAREWARNTINASAP